MVPYFRKIGDIVWVRTEFEDMALANAMSMDDTIRRLPVKKDGKLVKNIHLEAHGRKEHANMSGEDGKDEDEEDEEDEEEAEDEEEEDEDEGEGGQADQKDEGEQLLQDPRPAVEGLYFPDSRAKAVMRRASAKSRLEQRVQESQKLYNAHDNVEEYLNKPRKGQLPQIYRPGTHGSAIADELLDVYDESTDLVIVKNHYSALDATPLLLSLRMKLVTHIYLCGLLSNVSIYATAADAVRHGLEVTVVEDCIGYRSEEKHIDAMRKMADLLGADGVDSEEIIAESGGIPPPDADVTMFSGPGYEGILGQPMSRSNPGVSDTGEGVGHNRQGSLSRRSVDMLGAEGAAGLANLNIIEASETSEAREQSGSPSPVLTHAQIRGTKSDGPNKATLGPGDRIGEGDSNIAYDALPSDLSKNAFQRVRQEVTWQAMRHRSGEVPRRIAVQGDIGEDESRPIYRHPADESPPLSPFTASVRRIRDEVQKLLKQPFNHALIQLYRDGQDNISEHSDKVCRASLFQELRLTSLDARYRSWLKHRQRKFRCPTDNDFENEKVCKCQKHRWFGGTAVSTYSNAA